MILALFDIDNTPIESFEQNKTWKRQQTAFKDALAYVVFTFCIINWNS